jgi:hypothetical protein
MVVEPLVLVGVWMSRAKEGAGAEILVGKVLGSCLWEAPMGSFARKKTSVYKVLAARKGVKRWVRMRFVVVGMVQEWKKRIGKNICAAEVEVLKTKRGPEKMRYQYASLRVISGLSSSCSRPLRCIPSACTQ